jgi:hypothetical protein
MILFLTLGIAAMVEVYVTLSKYHPKIVLPAKTIKKHFPMAVQALVLVAQAGELVKVVDHVSPVNLAAALLLLAILVATRSGTEVPVD